MHGILGYTYRIIQVLVLLNLFVKTLTPEGHYKGPSSIERCDFVSTIFCPEQMHFFLKSCQVDPSLHPGLFSYELVSQNCEAWAVGTLGESWIDGS